MRSAVERRNAIVPQMRDYDALGERQRWVPHLMYFHPAQATYPSVTTDARGLRTVVGTDPDRIVAEAARLLRDEAEYQRMARAINPYGDGQASRRIVARLLAAS